MNIRIHGIAQEKVADCLEFQSLTVASKLVPGSERNDVSEFPGEIKSLPNRADSEQLKKGFQRKKLFLPEACNAWKGMKQ